MSFPREDILFLYDWVDVFGQKRRFEDRRHTVEGSPRGHGVIVLGINALCIRYAVLYTGLVFSGFVVAAKKAQKRHDEGEKKA